MKKTLALLMLIMLSSLTYCNEIIRFYSFGEIGYYIDKVSGTYEDQSYWFDASIAAGIESTPKESITLYAETELESDMYKLDELRFTPVQQDYYVRLGAWIGPINFKIEHLCSHSVDTFNPLINGGHDRISIGFDSRRLK